MTALFVPVPEPTLLGNQNLLNPIYILAFHLPCGVCAISYSPYSMATGDCYCYMFLIFSHLKAIYFSKQNLHSEFFTSSDNFVKF